MLAFRKSVLVQDMTNDSNDPKMLYLSLYFLTKCV